MGAEANVRGERMLELLTINNRMMHAARALRLSGMLSEADRIAEHAFGVWAVMCSIMRTEESVAGPVTADTISDAQIRGLLDAHLDEHVDALETGEKPPRGLVEFMELCCVALHSDGAARQAARETCAETYNARLQVQP